MWLPNRSVSSLTGGAGKAGLTDPKHRKHERKAKKETPAESTGGDLLGDLSAALGRRRKAMSGKEKKEERREEKTKEDHSLGGGSMMDNISRLIPSPQKAGGGGGRERVGSEEEADW